MAELSVNADTHQKRRALKNLLFILNPLIRRRFRMYGKALLEAMLIEQAARKHLSKSASEFIEQIAACANEEVATLDMDKLHTTVKHLPAEHPTAKTLSLNAQQVIKLPIKEPVIKKSPGKKPPVSPKITHPKLLPEEITYFQPRKVAAEISTLAHNGYAGKSLLIRSFCNTVKRDKLVLGSSLALAYTNKWLALADTTIKNDAPLQAAIKEKILDVYFSYLRYLKGDNSELHNTISSRF